MGVGFGEGEVPVGQSDGGVSAPNLPPLPPLPWRSLGAGPLPPRRRRVPPAPRTSPAPPPLLPRHLPASGCSATRPGSARAGPSGSSQAGVPGGGRPSRAFLEVARAPFERSRSRPGFGCNPQVEKGWDVEQLVGG